MLEQNSLNQLTLPELRRLVQKEASQVNKLMTAKTKELGELAPFSEELQAGLEASENYTQRSGNYFTIPNMLERSQLIDRYRQLNNLKNKLGKASKSSAIKRRTELKSFFEKRGVKLSKRALNAIASIDLGREKQKSWREAAESSEYLKRLLDQAKENGFSEEAVIIVGLDISVEEKIERIRELLLQYGIEPVESDLAAQVSKEVREEAKAAGIVLTEEEEDALFYSKLTGIKI